jgi:hypothetical protein
MKTLIKRACNFFVSPPNFSELLDEAQDKDLIHNPSLTNNDHWPELERVLEKYQKECGKPAFYRATHSDGFLGRFLCEQHYQLVKDREAYQGAEFEEIYG